MTIDITSQHPIKLSTIKANSIIVTEVQSITGELNDIFHPIKIYTALPDGRVYQNYFNPISYYSNRTRTKGTDMPFELPIHYCQFTELSINATDEVQMRLVFRVNEKDFVIRVNKDLDGYSLSLNPESIETIMSKFQNARPLRNIFISYNTKDDFNLLIGKLEEHVIPLLTDLNTEELELLGQIKLVDSITNKEIKKL